MRNIKAFLAALVLFVVTVISLQFYVNAKLPDYNNESGTWVNQSKIGCYQSLRTLLADESAVPVFGSSELKHGHGSGYQADTVFADADMEPVFIGQAGYQCLSHTITLGALGEKIEGRKVVLIVSPQWFKKKGVSTNAFGSSFSENNLTEFLSNTSISDESKKYVLTRIESLTAKNDVLLGRVEQDINWYGSDRNASLLGAVNRYWLASRAKSQVVIKSKLAGISGEKKEKANRKLLEDDWAQLRLEAETDGERLTGDNPYGMYDTCYKRTYQNIIEKKKAKTPNYSVDSVEGQDLSCFLDICKEEHITPMLVLLPFNGYWYDAIGYDSDARESIYAKVREIAAEHDVALTDLSSQEYSDCYFEDGSHPALKGLVDMNEAIYEFYQGKEY